MGYSAGPAPSGRIPDFDGLGSDLGICVKRDSPSEDFEVIKETKLPTLTILKLAWYIWVSFVIWWFAEFQHSAAMKPIWWPVRASVNLFGCVTVIQVGWDIFMQFIHWKCGKPTPEDWAKKEALGI